jgi:hypothetical protein
MARGVPERDAMVAKQTMETKVPPSFTPSAGAR